MNVEHIEKLALIVIADGKVLVALMKGQNNWRLPTTVRHDLETDDEALERLVKMQLSTEILPGTIQHFGMYETHAHAHGMNPEKTNKAMVRLKCFLGKLKENPQ